MTTEIETTPFESWAMLELMGHRRLAGLVTESVIAGAGFVTIHVYAIGDLEPRSAGFYGPASVYAITPMSEDACRTHATPWDERRALLEAGHVDVVDLVDDHLDEIEAEQRDRDEELAESLGPSTVLPYPVCATCGHRYDRHRHHAPEGCYETGDESDERCPCTGYEVGE